MEKYLQTNNVTESARAAGLKSPEAAGSRMLKSVKIQQALEKVYSDLRACFAREAAAAFAVLVNLMRNSATEMVRLKAAQDILDRAGYKPVERRDNLNVSVNLITSIDYHDPLAVRNRLDELRKRDKH